MEPIEAPDGTLHFDSTETVISFCHCGVTVTPDLTFNISLMQMKHELLIGRVCD